MPTVPDGKVPKKSLEPKSDAVKNLCFSKKILTKLFYDFKILPSTSKGKGMIKADILAISINPIEL